MSLPVGHISNINLKCLYNTGVKYAVSHCHHVTFCDVFPLCGGGVGMAYMWCSGPQLLRLGSPVGGGGRGELGYVSGGPAHARMQLNLCEQQPSMHVNVHTAQSTQIKLRVHVHVCQPTTHTSQAVHSRWSAARHGPVVGFNPEVGDPCSSQFFWWHIPMIHYFINIPFKIITLWKFQFFQPHILLLLYLYIIIKF